MNTLLTKKELEVLGKISSGQTNKEIAETLGISVFTIRNHISRIFIKLKVTNRVQASNYAARLGVHKELITCL